MVNLNQLEPKAIKDKKQKIFLFNPEMAHSKENPKTRPFINGWNASLYLCPSLVTGSKVMAAHQSSMVNVKPVCIIHSDDLRQIVARFECTDNNLVG